MNLMISGWFCSFSAGWMAYTTAVGRRVQHSILDTHRDEVRRESKVTAFILT